MEKGVHVGNKPHQSHSKMRLGLCLVSLAEYWSFMLLLLLLLLHRDGREDYTELSGWRAFDAYNVVLPVRPNALLLSCLAEGKVGVGG